MEYCEGGTLTTWIREKNINKKQRNTTEIHQIFHEIVSGVEYVHSRDLIHRDLKVFDLICSCMLIVVLPIPVLSSLLVSYFISA